MSVGWVGYLRRSRSLSARRAQRITSIKHKINISITCKRNTNLGDGSLETLMVWTYLEVILAFPWREEVYRKGILTCHRIQLLQHPDPTLHWSNQSLIPIWQYMASMQSWKCLLSFRSKIKQYFGQIFNRIGGYSPTSLSRWLSTKHRKNCECCPVSLLIVRKQRMSWIQVLNCQNSNQCLNCQKSLW